MVDNESQDNHPVEDVDFFNNEMSVSQHKRGNSLLAQMMNRVEITEEPDKPLELDDIQLTEEEPVVQGRFSFSFKEAAPTRKSIYETNESVEERDEQEE